MYDFQTKATARSRTMIFLGWPLSAVGGVNAQTQDERRESNPRTGRTGHRPATSRPDRPARPNAQRGLVNVRAQ